MYLPEPPINTCFICFVCNQPRQMMIYLGDEVWKVLGRYPTSLHPGADFDKTPWVHKVDQPWGWCSILPATELEVVLCTGH